MKTMLIVFFIIYSFSFSKIIIDIKEPIRFKDFNTKALKETYIVGEGAFEIYTDNEKNDLGKKIIFKFPKNGIISNKKNQIKVNKYQMENNANSMILSTKREIVKFYALISKKEIKKNKDPHLLEGEYVGYVPIIFSLYEKNEDWRKK